MVAVACKAHVNEPADVFRVITEVTQHDQGLGTSWLRSIGLFFSVLMSSSQFCAMHPSMLAQPLFMLEYVDAGVHGVGKVERLLIG